MKRFTSIAVGAVVLTLLLSAISWAAPSYIVHADLVRSAAGTPLGPVCVPNSVFYPLEGVVVRAKVYDGQTGLPLDAAAIEERGVKVQVTYGELTLDLHYGEHPPDPNAPAHDEYWTVLWIIPADFPAGVIPWTVHVTDAAGAHVDFEPIGQNIGIPALMVLPAVNGGAPDA